MTQLDEQGRPEPPAAADETATLLGFLEFQRATFAWKCEGLDAEGLAATVAASPMTLGGMMKHLALVEDWWFSEWLGGLEKGAPWDAVDWDADADWDWHSAKTDTPDELRRIWQEAVGRSRARVASALETGDMGQLAKRTGKDGFTVSLRWNVCHMIEEYARHNGHADLIREAVDGSTGE
jgi:uncharacterized damage-inducible protein DinB